MSQKSKVLTQILLINLFTLLFLIFSQAHSKEFNCNSYKSDSIKLDNNNYPKFIEVVIPNSKKWMTRVLKSMWGDRIDKRYKKYQKVKIITSFSNNLKCEYWKGKNTRQ